MKFFFWKSFYLFLIFFEIFLKVFLSFFEIFIIWKSFFENFSFENLFLKILSSILFYLSSYQPLSLNTFFSLSPAPNCHLSVSLWLLSATSLIFIFYLSSYQRLSFPAPKYNLSVLSLFFRFFFYQKLFQNLKLKTNHFHRFQCITLHPQKVADEQFLLVTIN